MKPVSGHTARSTGADEAGVQKVSARILSRTFVQGPGQGQGLECQGPGPGPGLFLKDQDKDKDFTLVLKESLGQGQGQGLTSLGTVMHRSRSANLARSRALTREMKELQQTYLTGLLSVTSIQQIRNKSK